ALRPPPQARTPSRPPGANPHDLNPHPQPNVRPRLRPRFPPNLRSRNHPPPIFSKPRLRPPCPVAGRTRTHHPQTPLPRPRPLALDPLPPKPLDTHARDHPLDVPHRRRRPPRTPSPRRRPTRHHSRHRIPPHNGTDES